MPQPQPAIYLRCYPTDTWGMQANRLALQAYAHRLGLPAPTVYLDNGRSSRDTRPAFEHLARAVAAGVHRVVLVPGPWVFGLDPSRAAAEIQRLAAEGCEIVELPDDRSAAQARTLFSRSRTP